MLDEIYLRLPQPLQTLAVSGLGLRNRLRRHGAVFRKHEAFLDRSEGWSSDEIRRWQCEALAKLLSHAFQTVPYFRQLEDVSIVTPEDAKQLLLAMPHLEKSAIRSDPDRFTSEAFSKRDLVSVVTTGTTGSPMNFVIDRPSRQKHFAHFRRVLRWAGLDTSKWHAVFMGRILGTEAQLRRCPWRVDYSNRRFYFSSYHIAEDTVERYARCLSSRPFEWIEGYPSAIANLARLARENDIKIRPPRAIIPSSETLDKDARGEIEDHFGPMIYEFYAAAEQAAFISQCEAGSLHVHPEYGMVEMESVGLNQDGVPLYEMLATSFQNLAMPLIRYRTGDLVTKAAGSCGCGRSFPTIGRIVGRTSVAVILPDGRRVTGISNVPKGLPIKLSQLVQVSDAVFEFRVVSGTSSWDRRYESILLRRLHDRLGADLEITVKVVEEIPPGPGGKYRLVRKL